MKQLDELDKAIIDILTQLENNGVVLNELLERLDTLSEMIELRISEFYSEFQGDKNDKLS